MGELSKLPNIGKEVERQLNEVGIESYEDLQKTGKEQRSRVKNHIQNTPT